MKRILAIVVAVALMLTFYTVFKNTGDNQSGDYGYVDDGRTELERVEDAVRAREPVVTIYASAWDTAWGTFESRIGVIRNLIGLDPRYYWVDFGATEFVSYSTNGVVEYVEIELSYHEELVSETVENQILQAAQALLQDLPEDASQWDKALWIHDALIRHVTYEYTDYDQNIYGALVEGKAVCSGFAVAYEYLLEMVGIECDTVFGYGDWVSAAFETDMHAWNIVNLEDENGAQHSYYVDTTWDNTDLYDADGLEYVEHAWFCLSQAQMDAAGHTYVEGVYDFSRLDLSAEEMNYYVVQDAVVTEYDLEAMAQMLRRQMEEGNNLLSVRWAVDDDFVTHKVRLEEEGLSQLLDLLELDSFRYSFSDTVSQNSNFCMFLYLNWPEEE